MHEDRGRYDSKVTSLLSSFDRPFDGGCYEKEKTVGAQPVKQHRRSKYCDSTSPMTGVVSESGEIQYHQNTPLVKPPCLKSSIGQSNVNAELAISLKELAKAMMFRKELERKSECFLYTPSFSDVGFLHEKYLYPLSCAYIDAEVSSRKFTI